ncbi:MAG: branched-chain amino acid transporter permease [Candidatus Eremiobacteraeota bacterium]|jgi:branched-chain amino acid transport system permease protein|nr:branched-chain amino acid transporter permease [Candidatus Eremiobacteraeota bacterium]
MTLVAEQVLNGLQFGVMIFLLAAGLTLVFGIMGVINLAHGSVYMLGAFAAAAASANGAPFVLAVAAGVAAAAVAGVLIELIVIRRLYARNHLDQVLATFALILIANDGVSIVWGKTPLQMKLPPALETAWHLGPITYPSYRVVILIAGLAVALGLAAVLRWTRFGMLVRAASTHGDVVGALGISVAPLKTAVFTLGAVLAGAAGGLLAPLLSVQAGMGEQILVMTFVAIIVGGLGSVRGAFAGAILVGLVDTLGRAFVPALLRPLVAPDVANALAGGIAAVSIYLLLAVVLIVRPRGLFPVGAA